MGLRWGLWVWSCPGVGDTPIFWEGVGVEYFQVPGQFP